MLEATKIDPRSVLPTKSVTRFSASRATELKNLSTCQWNGTIWMISELNEAERVQSECRARFSTHHWASTLTEFRFSVRHTVCHPSGEIHDEISLDALSRAPSLQCTELQPYNRQKHFSPRLNNVTDENEFFIQIRINSSNKQFIEKLLTENRHSRESYYLLPTIIIHFLKFIIYLSTQNYYLFSIEKKDFVSFLNRKKHHHHHYYIYV